MSGLGGPSTDQPGKAPNSAQPSYGGAVFLSYARVDDLRPPPDGKLKGWVTYLWEQLRWAMTQEGVPQAELWRDRYQIEPSEDFTEKIDAALKQAELFVPVLSLNWVQREWCQKELERFCELRPDDFGSRIVPIIKSEVPESDIPPALRNREGYRFFERESSGQRKVFYWRGLEDETSYFERVKQIAEWIGRKLVTTGHRPRASQPNSRPTDRRKVFVAAPADELRDAWQRLVTDLDKSGFAVTLPDGRLPDQAPKAVEAINAALDGADLAIHFLGDSEGVKPECSDEGIVRLQLRLARTHATAKGGPRILWAPRWMPDQRERERDPFEVTNRFGGIQAGEEVYAKELTDLSQWLRDRLMPRKPDAPPRPPDRVWVAGSAADDDALVADLANRLQACGLTVQPFFADDPLPTAGPAGGTLALVPWSASGSEAMKALLAKLAPLVSSIVVLRLPGGDERAKIRFFHRGVVVEPIDALPDDRPATRALLARLELAPPGAAGAP